MALKIKKCKGVTRNVTKRSIQFDDYRECLFIRKEQHRKMNVIRSHCLEIYAEKLIKLPSLLTMTNELLWPIYTEEINKIALSSDDGKRVIMADGMHPLAYGHTKLKKIGI